MSTWMLTGGAGYIGSHVAHAMTTAGHGVVVYDDLSTGSAERVPRGVPLIRGSVLDSAAVEATLRLHNVDGIVHLAAKKSVPESMTQPVHYFHENVGGFTSVLGAATAAGIHRIILSSSGAVIGTPQTETVDEECPTNPENPYGTTKLVCEWLLRDAGAAVPDHSMHHIALRYFNVAGAGSPELGDRGTCNLVPSVFRALAIGSTPRIYGGDYPTRDGSCVRDYVHVDDVARAHVHAVGRLERENDRCRPYGRTFNVGRGEGVTVKEVMAAVHAITGVDFAPRIDSRRPGDPAAVVGCVDRIADELGFRAALGLPDMIRSAWESWTRWNSSLPSLAIPAGFQAPEPGSV